MLSTRRLGRTEVRVSPLGLGAAPIGNLYRAIDDAAATATVAAAWTAGIRYFDTAPHYGLGLSERRLGAALAGYRRTEFAVSTKVGRLLVPNPAPTGRDEGFVVPDRLTRVRDYSRDGVRRSLESSVDRLGLDRIDIALVHDPDDHLTEAIEQSVPALVELREQGVIGAVGAGMNSPEPLRRIVAQSDVDVVMVAGRWTLLDRSAEPLLTQCHDRGVAVLAAAPFNSGLLAQAWPDERSTFDYAPVSADRLATARALAAAGRARSVTLPRAALQFPLQHPAVAAVVAGLGSPAEAVSAGAAMAEPVSAEAWAELAAVLA